MTVLLRFLIGTATAALSGMGVGGGGLLVLFLTLLCSTETPDAQRLNLLFFILSALSAAKYHLRHRTLPWGWMLFLTLCALPGVFLGVGIGQHLSADGARRCFGAFLLLSGASMLYRQIGKRKHFPKSLDD